MIHLFAYVFVLTLELVVITKLICKAGDLIHAAWKAKNLNKTVKPKTRAGLGAKTRRVEVGYMPKTWRGPWRGPISGF